MRPPTLWPKLAWAGAVLVAVLIGCLAARGGELAATAGEWSEFQRTVRPFLARHCLECHGDQRSGDVRLDGFTDEKTLAVGVATLDKALTMLRKHAMPPKRRPQPTDDEAKPVRAWLGAFIARVDRQLANQPAPLLVRRLNRTEYDNTVRDLLGVTLRPADDFPADVPGHGFDTVGGNLTVSPALVEKYLAAAEKVARIAVFGNPPMQPERTAHQPYFTADAFSKNMEVKFDYDETGMSLPSALHVVQRFAVDGEYRLRAVLRGWRPAGSDPIELGFWIDGKLVHETKVPVPTKVEQGRREGEVNGLWAEFTTPMRAGEHWLSVTLLRMYEGLPPAYKGPKPADTDFGITRAIDSFFPMYLDVVGPYRQAKGPSAESRKKVFGGIDPRLRVGLVDQGPRLRVGLVDQGPRLRVGLTNLARRAFRRPVREDEIDELVKLVTMVQKDGDSFEEGLCLALQRILISPHFLFRVETPAGKSDEPYRITQHALASRLSYFLWSSMPDDELLRCADAGTLRDPAVLEAQVRRMLADARSQALVENFGGQWLQTRALESHTPERNRFPEFTDYLRFSMRKETELFFDHILRADRPILDFLDANYTFLNQRLAEFYGIGGVKGHAFRKVDLTGTERGGILAQASVLAVSSYANRTSPVLRGKWVLENLLNSPPPPPPPDVPALEEPSPGKDVPVRVQLEKHRTNANCAACHARMDPLGFALEHFDAIGAWRDRDGKVAIDSSGTLPDGRSFNGYKALRTLLRSEPAAFTECLTEKLLIYALGRGLERSDRRAVQEIAAAAARDGYRFSSLIQAIVRSAPFQMKTEGP